MIFRHPEWLTLLPILLMLGFYLPQLGLRRPLRLALCLLLSLILAEPEWRRLQEGLDLWVLLDKSNSASQPMAKGQTEWDNLLKKSQGAQDRLFYLDYADEVMLQGTEGAALYDRSRNSTRTAAAINQALALAKKEGNDRPARVLVFSDGYSTESLEGIAEKLVLQGVELDFRLLRESTFDDFRVSALHLPSRAQIGEPFLIEIEVKGTQDARVPISLLRNGTEIKKVEVEISGGTGRLRLTDKLGRSGIGHYTAQIQPTKDAHTGNNRREGMIEITGGPRVLLLTAYFNDPLERDLQNQGFNVETVTSLPSLTPALLTGTRCVIFNNAPAYEIPSDFLRSLDFYVNEQGGGLLMAGGRTSFAAGGYFESAIDPLLPVSMEMKQEHRKLMVAMSIVMDRSGSMSMTASNGFTKMQLANEGAGNAIRYLGSQDLLSVYAVDSRAHEIVPLQSVGPNRTKMESTVRRIESTGGGIFVYEGLFTAWKELKKAPAGQRHILLFSDAADSEEPGDYTKLLKDITANSGTVSVIALGRRSDTDAALLEDIAKLGKGRLFFTDKAEELPSIFSQETIAVARSAFLTDPVPTQAASGWFEISSQKLDWPAEIRGYNLSYLRDWASQALFTKDEYLAPLVAYGLRGTGRCAAVSFPLGGEHSEAIRAWAGYGDFIQTLTRWLIGDQTPAGIGLKHHWLGSELIIELMHDPEWEPKLLASPPRLVLASDVEKVKKVEVPWERLKPGHFQARISVNEGQKIIGAVQCGRVILPFGPTILGSSTEWAFDEARVEELRRTSLASGGREALDLSQSWRSPKISRYASLQPALLLIALGLMLFEALVTRTGWRLPELAFPTTLRSWWPTFKPRTAPRPHLVEPEESMPKTAEKAPVIATEPKETSPPAIDRKSRFQRAKRKTSD